MLTMMAAKGRSQHQRLSMVPVSCLECMAVAAWGSRSATQTWVVMLPAPPHPAAMPHTTGSISSTAAGREGGGGAGGVAGAVRGGVLRCGRCTRRSS